MTLAPPTCHPDRKPAARGLCHACYHKFQIDQAILLRQFTDPKPLVEAVAAPAPEIVVIEPDEEPEKIVLIVPDDAPDDTPAPALIRTCALPGCDRPVPYGERRMYCKRSHGRQANRLWAAAGLTHPGNPRRMTVEEAAEKIAEKVARGPGVLTAGMAIRSFTSTNRATVRAGLDMAVEKGLVLFREGRGSSGHTSLRLYPGTTGPEEAPVPAPVPIPTNLRTCALPGCDRTFPAMKTQRFCSPDHAHLAELARERAKRAAARAAESVTKSVTKVEAKPKPNGAAPTTTTTTRQRIRRLTARLPLITFSVTVSQPTKAATAPDNKDVTR